MTPYTLTIPAAVNVAGVATVHVAGKYFLLTVTNGAFRVLTNLGDEYNFSQIGDGFGDNQSKTFGKLTFYNDTAVAVTITFYVSMSLIRSPDVAVNTSVTMTALLQNTMAGCAPATDYQIQKTTTSGVIAALAAPATYFRTAIIIAQKSLDRAANIGHVYIGVGAAHQPIDLAPDDVYEISAPAGAKRDLGAWYLKVDNDGDGVTLIYA